MAAELVEGVTAGNCLLERDFDEVGDDLDDDNLDDFKEPTMIVGSAIAISV